MSQDEPASRAGSDQRAWWLRGLLVLQSPGAVFAALRDDSEEAASGRQEPVTAIVYLAATAAVLSTAAAGRLLDDFEFDALLIVVWTIFAGGIYAFAGYWLCGALVHLGARALGAGGSYRRSRHLLGYAAAPLALSLLVVWPLQLAIFGSDLFRRGGSDAGAGGDAFRWLARGFILWALALLLVGLRAVHGWTWPRAAAAFALATALPALVVAVSLVR
jgi:hypothetical protein